MKQIECLSQTAAIETNKSQTTARLYQHPTPANTVRYTSKSGMVRGSIAAIIFGASITSGVISCSAPKHASAAHVEHLVKAGVKP